MATLLNNGTTTLVPTNTYAPGTYNSAVFSLSTGQSQIMIAADRNNWTDIGSDVISANIQISYDSGNTFSTLMGFTARGGTVINPITHTTQTQSTFSFGIPQTTNPNRQIKAIVQVFNSINTSVSVTVS